jgi:hypothetical protein
MKGFPEAICKSRKEKRDSHSSQNPTNSSENQEEAKEINASKNKGSNNTSECFAHRKKIRIKFTKKD